MLCNLQIFSGCVCPLEQLHAQSPFLFPIVFSINLIPFFDISSVLAVHSPGLFGYVLLYFTWATARSQELLFVVLACHALRALDSRCRLRTRRCIGSTRCRGNHMHDHSRFQRDIDDVTGVSLSLSLLLTKVTHAQYRKRFRASYNIPLQGSPRCGSDRENPSTKTLQCDHTHGQLCSQRNKTKCVPFWPVEQLRSSFFCESKACLLLVSLHTIAWCFELPWKQEAQPRAARPTKDVGRSRQRWLTRLRMAMTFSFLNEFAKLERLRLGKRKTFPMILYSCRSSKKIEPTVTSENSSVASNRFLTGPYSKGYHDPTWT